MKRAASLLLLILLCIGAGRLYYQLTDGFTLRRVRAFERQVQANFSPEICQALSQSFHYLGRGRQCFAFVSRDGKYVLKLPRTDIYQLSFWMRQKSIGFQEKKRSKRLARETFFLDSAQLAATVLQKETGVIAVHLGKSEPRGETLTLVDRLGRSFTLNRNEVSFILQSKYPNWTEQFVSALKKEPPKAAALLDALLETMAARVRLGIFNKDLSFLKNYGFDGEKAMQIDIGSFYLSQEDAHQSLLESSCPIREWLCSVAPELTAHFDERLHSLNSF